jgi:hypothetical protein
LPDRDSGKEAALFLPRTIRGPMELHGLFLAFLEHEAGEVWLVDGKRIYDPHRVKE